ncbi:thiol:disulfide interchange protein DsbC [Litchfieldella qijiaojingensis]|uniref:Thiol:disulfide interchange protein n=1 Tax=Litchfieldella qijiaojingensis TaxID=980347 RepID=A0ABQ2ZCA9_9GAMM|nr:DsbC family protein [Halomonas qijiaojingensis]GGY08159.1 thiol:disulfide interchange protein DsbC [Halomonas qijiaojingensis]
MNRHLMPAPRSLFAAVLTTLGLVTTALASTHHQLAERLTVNGDPMPVAEVRETPIDGFFEVRLESGETFYSDAEGKHFLVGDLYENSEAGLVNLTEQRRNSERAERLAQVPESEQVIFRGAGESRAAITVFTDTTCPYCRRLHEEVPKLNEMGIEVHYLAFPRAGMGSEGGRVLSQVWCADNRTEAMTSAKRGEALSNSPDCDNPVEDQYHLGMALGVQGTPAIVMPDGRMVPGYVPAERLAGMLGLDD